MLERVTKAGAEGIHRMPADQVEAHLQYHEYTENSRRNRRLYEVPTPAQVAAKAMIDLYVQRITYVYNQPDLDAVVVHATERFVPPKPANNKAEGE